MPLFEIINQKAKKVNTKEFKNEMELHQLIDMNLEEIFGVRFIKDEHITDKHGRIETLGLDESNRPLVIDVIGNYNCTVFRNWECTKNGNKSAHFLYV